MNDLISKQDAIEVAREELESGTYFDIPSKIESLPSAHPEPCGDMISKEYLKEHIEACWINGRPRHAPELNELLSWIDDVPFAQSEHAECLQNTKAVPDDRDMVCLSERVSATYYDDEHEEWSQKTVTIRDLLDGICDEYTVLQSAQPEPQWISCSEKYPDMDERVLVYTLSHEYHVWDCMSNRADNYFWEDEDGLYHDKYEVDMWMPLPQPYRKDGD